MIQGGEGVAEGAVRFSVDRSDTEEVWWEDYLGLVKVNALLSSHALEMLEIYHTLMQNHVKDRTRACACLYAPVCVCARARARASARAIQVWKLSNATQQRDTAQM